MSKTPYLIHRCQKDLSSALPMPHVAGRRFLFGPAAVLAALTLSAAPIMASGTAQNAKPAVSRSAAVPVFLGKTLQINLPPGASYKVQDGSVSVSIEPGDGYLLLTPKETGPIALTVNGVPYAYRVVRAQTTPTIGTGATTAPSPADVPVSASAGGTNTGAPTANGAAGTDGPGAATAPVAPASAITPVAPAAATTPVAPTAVTEPVVPLGAQGALEPLGAATQPQYLAPNAAPAGPALIPVAPSTSLPVLMAPTATSPAAGNRVPSGMAPLPSPPRVSPSLPPPVRTPARSPYPTQAGMPRNLPSGAPIKVINVTKGLASLLSFQRNILSVYFSDAVVMDARAINARTLAVTGVAPGKSTLAVFTATSSDDAVGQLHMFHIVVEPATMAATPQPSPVDPTAIETAIRTAINDPRIQVTAIPTGDGSVAVRLSGRVREDVERTAATETAGLFGARVINGILIDKDAPSYEQAFAPDTVLTPEELAQNQLRMVTGNQTIELTPLGGSWVLKGEVASQAEAQQLMTLANSLGQKIVPMIVVRGPGGITPAEQPITSPEDREMSRRLQEVTGIGTVYATRTAQNGLAVYGTVRNRLEFDRIQRYKNVLPVILQGGTGGGGGGGGNGSQVETSHPTHAYQSPSNIQMFVRIDDPAEAGLRLVTIDSNVVEISRTALKNLGIEFGSAQLLSETVTGPTTTFVVPPGAPPGTPAVPIINPGGVTRSIDPTFRPGVIQGGNGFIGTGGLSLFDPFRVRLNGLYQNGNANILSKPNVTTLEGTEAQITIGGARPIPMVSTSGAAGGTTQEEILFRRFGIILTMRPTVLADDTIILQVRVDVTDLDTQTGISRGNTFIPGETVRSVNNVLVLKEGDIIALGGLITNAKRRQTSRVPILSKIPILGSLFQSRRFENNESELAIFLTPTIKRVPVNSELTEYGLHAPSWPALSGINDTQAAFGLSSVAGGAGGGGR